MAGVFVNVILPVLVIAALGGWVGQRAGLPVAPLATVTFDLFSPALVFTSLLDIRTTGGTAARIVVVIVGGFVVLALTSMLLSKASRHDRPTLAAAALCAAVANMGNMGIPIAALAFGEKGLEVAVIAFVASAVLNFSGGVVIASLASGSMRAALRAPLVVPALWGAVLALGVNAADIRLPTAVTTSAEVLAGAAIPAMLMVLGLQVVRGMPTLHHLRDVLGTLALRLGLAPLVAAGIATMVGLGGVTRSTLVVLGGMPTAVNATILATRYEARPTWVTRAVVASTLLSVATITALVTVLR